MEYIDAKYTSPEYLENALWVNISSDKALFTKTKWKLSLWESDNFSFDEFRDRKNYLEAAAIVNTGGYRIILMYFNQVINFNYIKSNHNYMKNNFLGTRLVSLLPKNHFLLRHFLNLHPDALVFDKDFMDKVRAENLTIQIHKPIKNQDLEWFWLHDYRQHTLNPEECILIIEKDLSSKRRGKRVIRLGEESSHKNTLAVIKNKEKVKYTKKNSSEKQSEVMNIKKIQKLLDETDLIKPENLKSEEKVKKQLKTNNQDKVKLGDDKNYQESESFGIISEDLKSALETIKEFIGKKIKYFAEFK